MVAQIVSLEEVLGTRDHWHIALSLYIILVLVCFLPYKILPESPKYLYIVAGKREEARNGELKINKINFNKHVATNSIPIIFAIENHLPQFNCFS